MMEAIANAQLGDDVFEDDPTVNSLQEIAAEKLGMETSLFVPSGTMGNLIAMLAHCNRGEEIIVGNKSHIFQWEGGNVAAVGGIHPYVIPNQSDGTLAPVDIEAAVRVEDVHLPRSKTICIENTQNNCGGIAIPPKYFAIVRQIAVKHNLTVHLDGARLFNASVALNVPVTEFTHQVDSVMVCLSKGLCAPVGSVLAGSNEFIYKARKFRKMLGGGMRQAGILAAAGIISLEAMVDRLVEDHTNAAKLRQGLLEIDGIESGINTPSRSTLTNMVYFKLSNEIPILPEKLVERCEYEYKIKIDPGINRQFRLVTHYWVTAGGVERTLEAFQDILSYRLVKTSSTREFI
jgi:threonine aldolase